MSAVNAQAHNLQDETAQLLRELAADRTRRRLARVGLLVAAGSTLVVAAAFVCLGLDIGGDLGFILAAVLATASGLAGLGAALPSSPSDTPRHAAECRWRTARGAYVGLSLAVLAAVAAGLFSL